MIKEISLASQNDFELFRGRYPGIKRRTTVAGLDDYSTTRLLQGLPVVKMASFSSSEVSFNGYQHACPQAVSCFRGAHHAAAA